ncbi:MAG: PDZ domain-containing protein [Pirellulaceae bacterium]
MNHKMLQKMFAILVLVTVSSNAMVTTAQDEVTSEESTESDAGEALALRWFTWNQDEFRPTELTQFDQFRAIPMWVHGGSNLASHDGEYLAQSGNELLTYYDLGMTWQFISEDWMRSQLQLPDEQGLIVQTADESGAGYKNGFRAGDIILLIDDESVDTQYDFVIAITGKRGQQCAATIRRKGEPMELAVLLSEIDESETPSRYIIGVSVDEISDILKAQLGIEQGVAVTSVTEDGPAIKNGMVPNDIITHLNGDPVGSVEQLRDLLQQSGGESIELTLVRSAANLSITLTPQAVPVDPVVAFNAGVDFVQSLTGRYRVSPQFVEFKPGASLLYPPTWNNVSGEYQELVDLASESRDGESAAILQRLDAIEEQLSAIREAIDK